MESQPPTDLNGLFAAWRRHMAERGVTDESVLDELECHLRDEVDRLLEKGLTERQAFFEACIRLGHEDALATEYRKARELPIAKREPLKAVAWMTALGRSYLVVAWRNLRRQRSYAFINVMGLAVGIACVLLVFLYIRHEFSFDNFNTKGDRIYRLLEHGGFVEKQWKSYVEGDPVSEMRTSYTEVEDAVRFMPRGTQSIHLNGEVYSDVEVVITESNLFNIFTLPLKSGNPNGILDRPHVAVITHALAQKLFKGENPIGKFISATAIMEPEPFEITGVMEDVPENTHFSFDLLLSYATLEGSPLCTTCGQPMYALLKSGADPNAIAKRLLTRITKVDGKEHVDDIRLEPLRDIYFSDVLAERQGSMSYVYVLSTISLVILLIACANYMNLATARSAGRAREVGIRKVVGAYRTQITSQFLAEALLLALLAIPLALILLMATLHAFNALAGSHVALSWGSLGSLILACTALLFIIGLIGGSYPALYLSAFVPMQVLKGRIPGTFSATLVRKGLVTFQFAAAIVLIAATVVVLRQLSFVQEQELGFHADQIILVKLQDPDLFKRGSVLKQEFQQTPSVLQATAAFAMPGQKGFSGRHFGYAPEGKDGPKLDLVVSTIDEDFLRTVGIPLVAGRNIKPGPGQMPELESLLNERAVHALGFHSAQEALGEKLAMGVVVGVVKDFNFASLHEPITPLIMQQNNGAQAGVIALKVRGGSIPSTLAMLKKTWARLAPGIPFEFSFLNDEINHQYEREQRAGKVFGIFAGLAILLACLGLFGLTAFTAMSRTKEIGIRKVLGASAMDVVVLLSKNFVLLLLIAFVVALPVAYLAMNRWLEDFAYRIHIGPGIFLAAGAVALVIAIASVSVQVLRAARANPADSLRYE